MHFHWKSRQNICRTNRAFHRQQPDPGNWKRLYCSTCEKGNTGLDWNRIGREGASDAIN
jgi:hypothetical protein